MDSAFKLLVTIIIVAAIIFIITQYFQEPHEDSLGKMRRALDFAEATQGRVHSTSIILKRDEGLKAELLDTVDRSVRFECSSAETCSGEGIIIRPRLMLSGENRLHEMHFRCKRKGLINDCVIYFGEKPAQLEISQAELEGGFNAGEKTLLSFEVHNSGLRDAVEAGYEVRIYRNENIGEETEILKNEFRGKIVRLERSGFQKILAEFTIDRGGEYLMRIIADGEDSGRAIVEKEFIVTGAEREGCVAVASEKPFFENGACRTQHTCSGCEFGFECKQKWVEKGVDEWEITEFYATGVYTVEPSESGACK